MFPNEKQLHPLENILPKFHQLGKIRLLNFHKIFFVKYTKNVKKMSKMANQLNLQPTTQIN